MDVFEDVGGEDSFAEHQQYVRDRAHQSLHGVRKSLNEQAKKYSPPRGTLSPPGRKRDAYPGGGSGGRVPDRGNSPTRPDPRDPRHRGTDTSPRPHRWLGSPVSNDYSYKSAVARLRGMLHKAEQEARSPPPPPTATHRSAHRDGPRMHDPHDPSIMHLREQPVEHLLHRPPHSSQHLMHRPPHSSPPRLVQVTPVDHIGSTNTSTAPAEIVPLIHHQSACIGQMEKENTYLRDELTNLKLKCQEVIQENYSLHNSLKSALQQAIVTDGENEVPGLSPARPKQRFVQWKHELEQIHSLHTAKCDRLESQLTHTRNELEKCEQLVDELQSKLRVHDSLQHLSGPRHSRGGASGPCPKCRLHESSGYQSQSNHQRELDGMISNMAAMKARMIDLEKREEAAYEHVKRSVVSLEQAELEKTQAHIEKEQSKEETRQVKLRFEKLIKDFQRQLDDQREATRRESQAEIEELHVKLQQLSDLQGATKSELEKAMRDKISLTTELKQISDQFNYSDRGYKTATEDLRKEMTQAGIERNNAVQDATRMRSELDKERRNRQQEKERLTFDSEDVRRRLNLAEEQLVTSKEYVLSMTSKMQDMEREVHTSKMTKDSQERSQTEAINSLSRRAQQREEELSLTIQELEVYQEHTTKELEEMISKQNKLIARLRDECRVQASQLEAVTEKYRTENRQLKVGNEEMACRLERKSRGLKEMEDQHVKHGRLHERMRQRIKQMEEHGQHQGQQILDMLCKQNGYLRDRQLLAKEVEFLRRQLVVPINDTDCDKMASSHEGLVDDILNCVQREHRSQP